MSVEVNGNEVAQRIDVDTEQVLMNYTRTSARSLLLKVSDLATEHLYVTLPHAECVETGLGLDWDCASMPREEVFLAKCFIQFACVIARFGSCDHASKLYKNFGWITSSLGIGSKGIQERSRHLEFRLDVMTHHKWMIHTPTVPPRTHQIRIRL